jgi:hypothetical protein
VERLVASVKTLLDDYRDTELRAQLLRRSYRSHLEHQRIDFSGA